MAGVIDKVWPRYTIVDKWGNEIDYAQGVAGVKKFALEVMRATDTDISFQLVAPSLGLAVCMIEFDEAVAIMDLWMNVAPDRDSMDIHLIKITA